MSSGVFDSYASRDTSIWVEKYTPEQQAVLYVIVNEYKSYRSKNIGRYVEKGTHVILADIYNEFQPEEEKEDISRQQFKSFYRVAINYKDDYIEEKMKVLDPKVIHQIENVVKERMQDEVLPVLLYRYAIQSICQYRLKKGILQSTFEETDHADFLHKLYEEDPEFYASFYQNKHDGNYEPIHNNFKSQHFNEEYRCLREDKPVPDIKGKIAKKATLERTTVLIDGLLERIYAFMGENEVAKSKFDQLNLVPK